MYTSLKRQFNNVFRIKSIDLFPLFRKFFFFNLDYRLLGKGRSSYPINLTFEITYRCNLKCDFCFLKTSVLNKTEQKEEITIEHIRNVLKEVHKFKPGVYISGGEPLVRHDIIEIIKLVKSFGLRCGINTNGTLLNKEIIKNIIDSELDYIIISVDRYRRNTENIIQLTKERGERKKPRVFINYVLFKDNLDGLGSLIDHGKKTKVDGIFLEHLYYTTKKDLKANKVFCDKYYPNLEKGSYLETPTLKEEEKKKLIDRLRKIKAEAKKKNIFLMVKPDLSEENLKRWYSDAFSYLSECFYLWNVARINPKGDVCPCYMYRMSMGNIKNEKFLTIWNNEKFRRFRKLLRKGLFPGCNRCCKL